MTSELSKARTVLNEVLVVCEELKTIVAADSIEALQKGWGDKLEQLGQVIHFATDDTKNEKCEANGSPLWKLIHSLVDSLKKLESAATIVENLQTPEENAIEVLSLQQQVLVQICINLILGYAARCLIPYEINVPGRASPTLHPSAVNVYSVERSQLNPVEIRIRFSVIMSILRDYLYSQLTIFKRLVLRSQNLIPCLLHFLYSEARDLTRLDFELVQFVIRDHFFHLSSDQGFRILLFHCFDIQCPQLRTCAIRGIRDLQTLPGNLARLLQHSVSEGSWYNDCKLFPQILKIVLKEPNTTELCSIISVQIRDIILDNESSPAIKRVAISIALLTSTNPKFTEFFTKHVWESVFYPISELFYNLEEVSIKLDDLAHILELYVIIIEVACASSPNSFLRFRSSWAVLVSIYATISSYLDRPVRENDQFLTEWKDRLGEFVIKIVSTYANDVEPETIQESGKGSRGLAMFLVSLIVGQNESKRTNSMSIELVSDENGNLNSFRRVADVCEVKTTIVTISTHFVRLLSTRLDHKVLKVLFAQLLQFDGPIVETQMMSKNEIRFKEEVEEQINFSDYDIASRFVATFLLGEFGSTETNLDQILHGIEQEPESAFDFLSFMIKRVEVALCSWIDECSSDGHNVNPYPPTLVQSLEMIEILCETTYDEEMNTSKQSPSVSSDADERLKKALIGWKKLDTFKSFLRKVMDFQSPLLIQVGVSTKCENLLMMIETRGRSRGKKTEMDKDEYMEEPKKIKLEEILFNMNSGAPSIVSSGLIQLKKLIWERDPRVDSSLDVIIQQLFVTLDKEDEYIYNHSINTLVALTIEKHDILLPQLLDQYAPKVPKVLLDKVQLKLKLGEVLCKTLSSLGPISVNYASPILIAAQRNSSSGENPQVKISAYQVINALMPNLGAEIESYLVKYLIRQWLLAGLDHVGQEAIVRVAIWNLIETLVKILADNVDKNRWMGTACTVFAREASVRSKMEPLGEDDRERQARERVRFEARELAMKILDTNCQQLNQIKIL